MGVAYFIVPAPTDRRIVCEVNGKPLAHIPSARLNRACREAGVRPLSEFFSQNPDEAREFLESEGIDPPEEGFPPEQWFDAADGLRTIRALLERVDWLAKTNRHGVTPETLAADLRDFEVALAELDQAGVRWHLEVDG